MKSPKLLIIGLLFLLTALTAASAVRHQKNKPAQTEEDIKQIVASMTLPEKIGQMVLVDKNNISPDDVRRKVVGAVLSGGGGNPARNTPEEWRRMVTDYQTAALNSKIQIPLLYGVDAVHGHGNVKEAVIFPHNIGLGATRDAALVRQIAEATAKELKATGVNWNYAPVLSIPSDLRWGRVYECFGTDQAIVAELGLAYVNGLQAQGIIATPKHFIGEGAEEWNSSKDYKLDQGNIDLSLTELKKRYSEPFKRSIDAGAMSIMVSRSSLKGTKISANTYLLTDYLKGELGFRGFLVSDWGAVDQIGSDYYKDVVTAINAGLDMVMLPGNYDEFISNLSYAVNNNDIPQERIDDAVTRILRAKMSIGLFDKPIADKAPQEVGSEQHRELAQKAVRESLVLLKNEHVLPIKNPTDILIVGRAADDIGMQSGGWTIDWQGNHGDITIGTSLLTAFKKQFTGAEIHYDPEANDTFTKKAKLGVVVIGEQPYAEGKGDRDSLELSLEDIQRIDFARAHSEKVLIIILAGRPLIIEKELAKADAIVMAWLPGSEGDGITEVLSGDYNFTGRLPLDWPRTMDDIKNKKTDRPLFQNGYGLDY